MVVINYYLHDLDLREQVSLSYAIVLGVISQTCIFIDN